jgi:Tfp pilus assembly protein PilN
MPAKAISINLLGQQDLEHTPWGRIVSWATTYGRYIMITTEIVVLLAFISRFSLDRKLTDLTEETNQKQAIIDANLSFEKEVKSVQANLATAKQLISTQSKPIVLVTMMETMLPPDVYLSSIDLTGSKMSVAAIAGTTAGFSQFLANLGASKELKNVSLGDINRQAATGIEFQFSADVVGAVAPAK